MPKKKQKRRQSPERAVWTPEKNNQLLVFCSKCQFRIETLRAVETGWTSSEHVATRYHFCPVCGLPMSVYNPELEAQRSAAAAAAPERGNAVAGPENRAVKSKDDSNSM